MKLIPTWRHDVHKLWSVRLALVQAVIGAGATAYAFYTPDGRPWPAVVVFLFGVAIAAARLIRQKGSNGDE